MPHYATSVCQTMIQAHQCPCYGFTTSSCVRVWLPCQLIKRQGPDFLYITILLTADCCMNAGGSQTSAPRRSWREYMKAPVFKARQASRLSTSADISTVNVNGKGVQATASDGPSVPMQPSDGGTSRPGAVPYS